VVKLKSKRSTVYKLIIIIIIAITNKTPSLRGSWAGVRQNAGAATRPATVDYYKECRH